jgi:hypothetical protein
MELGSFASDQFGPGGNPTDQGYLPGRAVKTTVSRKRSGSSRRKALKLRLANAPKVDAVKDVVDDFVLSADSYRTQFPVLGRKAEPLKATIVEDTEAFVREPYPNSRVRASKKQKSLSIARRTTGYRVIDAFQHAAGNDDHARLAAKELRDHYRKLATFTGIEEALKFLKSQAGLARTKWICSNASSRYAQLSYVGRALPTGTAETIAASLRQHALDLSVPAYTDSSLLGYARSFASGWARRFCLKASRLAKPDLPTLSSCMERTVAKGGLRGHTADLGLHPKAEALWSDPLLTKSLPPQDIQSLVNDMSLIYHGIDGVNNSQGYPCSAVVPIVERGLKVRIITKSPAHLHYLGHVVRKRLLGGLRKDPASHSPLAGVVDDDLIDSFVGSIGETCVSTDLTRATDLLPFDLVAAIVDGLQDSGQFLKLEIDCLRLITGPQVIRYPPSSGIAEFTSQRGILMGLPTSWAILSIIHLFWWNRSIKSASLESRFPLKDAFRLNRFAICGDDALFIGQDLVAQHYKLVVAQSGGSVSPGKHYEVSLTNSPTLRGVFLERLFEFVVFDGHVLLGSRNESIPLRGLVDPNEAEYSLAEYGSRLALSKSLKLLFAVDATWSQHPGSFVALRHFLVGCHPNLYKFASSLGLVNNLPLKFGGSGLPEASSLTLEKVEHQARAILAEAEGITLPVLIRGEISSLWQMASEMSLFDLTQYFEDGTNVRLPPGSPCPDPVDGAQYESYGSYPETVKEFATMWFNSYALMMEDRVSLPTLREKQIRRAVKSYVSSLPLLGDKDPYEIVANGVVHDVVWIRRTLAPDNRLLRPPWAGESRASEALLRSQIVGAAGLDLSVDPI